MIKRRKFSRTTVGIVAGLVGLPAGLAVGALEARITHGLLLRNYLGEATFFAVAGAVLWLADRFDLMQPAYTRPLVDPYSDDRHEPSSSESLAEQPTLAGLRRR